MKHFIFICSLLYSINSFSQDSFKGLYTNKDLNLRFNINFHEQTIPQPQFEEEMCYGVLSGALNGRWIVLKILELNENKAIVRAVSDSGVEAQTLEVKPGKNTLEVRQSGGTNIRGVKNSKYTKLPKTIILTKKQ